MDREQKAAAVAELTDSLKQAEAIFAVDYRGISVTQAAELRRRLVDADAVFRVVKNRLAKRAVADAGTEGVGELLVGPTALTLIKGDAVVAAKAIATFTREHQVLEYKGGLMDGEALDAESFQAIARLPGLEVLHGQLVGLTASPLTGLVTGLNSMISGLAIALGQIAEQGLVSGEAPAEARPPPRRRRPRRRRRPPKWRPPLRRRPPRRKAPGEAADESEQATAEEQGEPPAEHAEQEAQPEEPDEAPAEEPPSEPPGDSETSNDDDQEQEEPSGDESDN